MGLSAEKQEGLDRVVPGWRELTTSERQAVPCPMCNAMVGMGCFQKGDEGMRPTKDDEHAERIEKVMAIRGLKVDRDG